MGNYIIYIHTSPSGRCYIGQTCQKTNERWKNGIGYKRHPHFYKAIQKYGWDNFEHKILFDGLSKLDADLIEVDLIYYYKKIDKSYNLAAGGEGYTGLRHSDETKKQISEKNRGKKRSEETKKRMSEVMRGKPSWNKGKTFSKETRKKMSESSKKVSVVQYDLEGNIIKIWDSISWASKALKIGPINITRACRGDYKTAGNYKWEYYERYKPIPEEDEDD